MSGQSVTAYFGADGGRGGGHVRSRIVSCVRAVVPDVADQAARPVRCARIGQVGGEKWERVWEVKSRKW